MKRKSRPRSGSPLTSEDEEASLNQRRSKRTKKLNYQSYNTDWMIHDQIYRHRAMERQWELRRRKKECKRSPGHLSTPPRSPQRVTRSHSSPKTQQATQTNGDTDGDQEHEINGGRDSPFYNHVRFSPSAKTGSPVGMKGRTRGKSLYKEQLQNLTSEDEQSEFNRRYSRDMRNRRGNGAASSSAPNSAEATPRSSSQRKIRKARFFSDSEATDGDLKKQQSSRYSAEENGHDRPVRSTRSKAKIMTESEHDIDDDEEEVEAEQMEEEQTQTPSSKLSGRQLRSRTPKQKDPTDSDHGGDNDDDDEDTPHLNNRRSTRRARSMPAPASQPMVSGRRPGSRELRGLRRDSTEEDEDIETESRIRKRRVPERLTYSPPRRQNSNRRRSEDIQNLDKYSTDDEYQGDSTRSRKKHNLRENRTRTTRFEEEYLMKRNERTNGTSNVRRSKHFTSMKKKRTRRERLGGGSSSSSSSSESDDEGRFEKRKSKRIAIERRKLCPINMGKEDLTKAIFRDRKKVGSSMADVSPMEMDMGVSFDSVGGLDEHVNSLKEMVMFPLLYPELFKQFSVTPPRGVLFYGPPGTGKTLIARALACEYSKEGRKVAFFMRKGADCLSKWIGESERQLRLLFDQAYLMRPSIIFFDEIDGLAPVRSSRQDQIHSSIVSTLLALMDGLDNRGEIIVIGATNRIENIDPALRRPGRFDRELRFSLPTRDARKSILSLTTREWKPNVPDPLLNCLADKTIGYCGADLKGLCAEAALNALRRRYPQVYTTNQKLALDFAQIMVTEKDFNLAMKKIVPSTHRVHDQFQSPLPSHIKPLLQTSLDKLVVQIERTLPTKTKCNAPGQSYRPRLLITGLHGQGQVTYVGPAVLHYLEKLPCQKLDNAALFSNASRTPEEACIQVIHEAHKSLPGILYMPHLEKLWRTMSETVKEILITSLADIHPSAQLLLIAVTEEPYENLHDDIKNLFTSQHGEVHCLENPNAEERKEYFQPIFTAATQPPKAKELEEENNPIVEEDLPVLPVKESRELTEKEEKRLRKKEKSLLRELRIFLRDIWGKINREQKFFMFRFPVSEDVYDYNDIVKNPMDFDTMLSKLDNGEYSCAQDFLDDIDLISENAIMYNSDVNYETNKIICHRARALQDFAYALVKAEMDTDFEEECKDIVERRTTLTKKLDTNEEVSVAATETVEELSMIADDGSPKETDKTVDKTESPRRSSSRKSQKKWKRGQGKTPTSKKTTKKTNETHETSSESESAELESPKPGPSNTPKPVTTDVQQVKIDLSLLKHQFQDLIRLTNGFTVEKLERTSSKLHDLVNTYSLLYERKQLTVDLKAYLDTLKA